MNVFARQASFNDQTRETWDVYQQHRQQTSDLLLAIGNQKGSPSQSTLAILGAGNGNDVDLQKLAAQYARIHLFDFDDAALSFLREQHLAESPASDVAVVEESVDLSGIAHDLNQLPESINRSQILELNERARNPDHVLPNRRFDVVVSCCMLTQLLWAVAESFGDQSPWKNPMMIAVRDGHLQLMNRMLNPNGVGLLVTDFVSSNTLPQLKQASAKEEVLRLAQQALEQKNFFTGANPLAIRDSLQKMQVTDPSDRITIEPPWRWRLGNGRFYIVTAIGFTKSS